MKKIYYFILILLVPSGLFAQITITQSDLPVIGLAMIDAVDTPFTSAIPAGGANQTWNYNNLQTIYTDSTWFQTSSGTPYASAFPGANMVTVNTSNGNYNYYTTNSTGIYVNGSASATSAPFIFTPPILVAPVPFTYTNTRSNVSRIVVDTTVSGLQVQIIINFTAAFEADGYGELKIPNGNFLNTLRVKATQTIYDSTILVLTGTVLSQSASQTTSYTWYRNGSAARLLTVAADSLGQTANRASYLLTSGFVGIQEPVASTRANAYPNPACNTISFFGTGIQGEARLQVYNSYGQLVKTASLSGLDGIAMNVAGYENGEYYYTLTSNSKMVNGKFTVIH